MVDILLRYHEDLSKKAPIGLRRKSVFLQQKERG